MRQKTALFIVLLILALCLPCSILAEGSGQVTIRPGDTLSGICNLYGVRNWQAVAGQNNLSSPDTIVAGGKLFLPISQDQIDFPIKKGSIPQAGIACLSVTNDFAGWQGDVTADLLLSTQTIPMLFLAIPVGKTQTAGLFPR